MPHAIYAAQRVTRLSIAHRRELVSRTIRGMGSLTDRLDLLRTWFTERLRRGLPECSGPLDRELVVVVDGVGGFQFAPPVVRRVLRTERHGDVGTIVYRWQCWLVGEIWTDLMWLKRNRLMGARLARKLLALRRQHRHTRIHILAYSGGCGIAVFACESLRNRRIVDTLILAAPALSPAYNLSAAVGAAARCYALVSHRDSIVLGIGTSLFGTTDRRRGFAAGCVGFRAPDHPTPDEQAAYDRIRQIRWAPNLANDGNSGGHAGWIGATFLRRHLVPLLEAHPKLPTEPIKGGRSRSSE